MTLKLMCAGLALAMIPPVTALAWQDPASPVDAADPSVAPEPSPYDQTPEPPLPQMPPVPTLPDTPYPDCREAYREGANYLDRADLINACTVAIHTYYLTVLLPHRQTMIDYQNELTRLYLEQVVPNTAHRAASSNAFYDEMIARHNRANPDGADMAAARAAETRYAGDRAYLEDRFCFNTGCGQYGDPVARFPDEVAEMQRQALAEMQAAEATLKADKADRSDKGDKPAKSGKSETSKREGKTDQKVRNQAQDKSCKRARKRGSALGSFLGSAAGAFGGLGRTGSALLTGFSGILVGEIACKLDEKEQEAATQATVTVLAQEEVGARAEWTSPTREGVGGSSTVAAVDASPNGKKCLTINDVAIIDGEETRVSKQMCRAPGAASYVLVA